MTADPPAPVSPDDEPDGASTAAVARLLSVMERLRTECPWDREQTHRSLVPYLVEETYEVVEAIETGSGGRTDAGRTGRPDREHLVEELGDLLLQIVFHARISRDGPDGFSLDDVAAGIADKLVRRHPHVFAGAAVSDDLDRTWEEQKAAEKGRRSVLDGIAVQLPPLARAAKVIGRARTCGLDVDVLPGEDVGAKIIALVVEADRAGTDVDQSVRDALRVLEAEIVAAESPG